MRYEYQGIKLGDSIEKIIDLLNNKNTKFDDFYSYLGIKGKDEIPGYEQFREIQMLEDEEREENEEDI